MNIDESSGEKNHSKQSDQQAMLTTANSNWFMSSDEPAFQGEKYSLQKDMVVGRDEDCDIVIPIGHASRRHAKILLKENGVFLQDLDSSNGTFVNDQRVENVQLKSGDKIRFDTIEFLVVQKRPEPAKTIVRDYAPAVEKSVESDSKNQQASDTTKDLVEESKDIEQSSLTAQSVEPETASPLAQSGLSTNARSDEPVAESTPTPERQSSAADKISEPEPPVSKQPEAAPERQQSSIEKPTENIEAEVEAEKSATPWWETQEKGPNKTVIMSADAVSAEQPGRPVQIPTQIMSTVDTPSLVGVSAPVKDQIFKLDSQKTTLGRAGSNDIVLDEGSVSVRHAQIVSDNNTWKVVDLLAANRTLVNGERVQVSYLSPGDIVTLGRVELRFVLNGLGNEPTGSGVDMAGSSSDIRTSSQSSSGKKWLYMFLGIIVVCSIAGAVLFLST